MTEKKSIKPKMTKSSGTEVIFKNLLFVLFISFLGIVYIANSYFAEKKVRKIQALKKEVKDLRWEYMALRSEIMYESKLSEVSSKAEEKDIKLTKPLRIIIE